MHPWNFHIATLVSETNACVCNFARSTIFPIKRHTRVGCKESTSQVYFYTREFLGIHFFLHIRRKISRFFTALITETAIRPWARGVHHAPPQLFSKGTLKTRIPNYRAGKICLEKYCYMHICIYGLHMAGQPPLLGDRPASSCYYFVK